MTWPLQSLADGLRVAELAARNLRPDGVTPISPVPGIAPGFRFGAHPSNPKIRYANSQNRHTGVDFPGQEGDPIVAVRAGIVVNASWGGAYGNWTQIRDAETDRCWVYCHQESRTVKVGDRVKVGQVIGRVGHTSSGYLSGPHLHLELSAHRVWKYNDVIDPLTGW